MQRHPRKRLYPPWKAFLVPCLAACVCGISLVSANQPSLRFENNQGQTDSSVRFLCRAPGYTLYLTDREAVFSFARAGLDASMRLAFVDADPDVRIRGLDALPGRTNYLLGNDPRAWRTGVPSHGQVIYEQLYPGIDLLFHERDGAVEIDFVVAPGADPRKIALAVKGADDVILDGTGALRLSTAGGELEMQAPVVYQELDGRRVPVEGRFVVDAGNRAASPDDRRIRFELGEFDANRTLVIDPILSFSTYLGGDDAADEIQDLAVDGQGNTYVIGGTSSDDFPLANAMDSMLDVDDQDGFVSKISADGSTLVYSTYFGGDRDENRSAAGIAVNAAGEAFLTGVTRGGTFPTTAGAFEEDPQGTTDCYVAKLSADGSTLIYSTILGGSEADECRDIAVDGSGNAYVVGWANSSGYPTTEGAFQEIKSSAVDVVVTKVNAAGSGLVYSTFIGGSGVDRGTGITLVDGDAVITGHTTSTVNYPLASAFQGVHGGGTFDGFVTRLNSTGSALVSSSFFGGVGFDFGLGIASDNDGSVFITGITQSTDDFPVTIGAFQEDFGGGGRDAFVIKVDATGGLVYSTHLGGSGDERGTGIAVAGGFARLTGTTTSFDFPTVQAIQDEMADVVAPNDAFVTTVNADGTALAFSTFLGGMGSAGLNEEAGIAIGPDGAIHVAGRTSADDFPTTPGAFQDTDPDVPQSNDGFVAKIHECDVKDLVFLASKQEFEWSAAGLGQCSVMFDAARGDLFDLRNTAGDFSSAFCLEDADVDTAAVDAVTPLAGAGFFYLVRVDGSTWNTAAVQGDRDPTVLTCP
jgi:hypothetical protein